MTLDPNNDQILENFVNEIISKNRRKQVFVGVFFGVVWLSINIFYCLWDGWIYEWADFGYLGPNQHFDFDLFDMKWEIIDGEIYTFSTNNLHNIFYLCNFQFFCGWMGLMTQRKIWKQGSIALLGFPFIAIITTLNPQDHAYIVQIVYDIVHLSGTFLALIHLYDNEIDLKEQSKTIGMSWVLYIFSRLITQKWPFWDSRYKEGYFNVNLINTIPWNWDGLEYIIVIVLLFGVNKLAQSIQRRVIKKNTQIIAISTVYFIIALIFYFLFASNFILM